MLPIKGRGTQINPPNRFVRLEVIPELEDVAQDAEYLARLARPDTQYIPDSSRSILARNDSPDIPFSCSINPYRGCTHGCAYCYARPTHEYLGYSSGLEFETRILVKSDAPALLREALYDPKWIPETIAISGVTDCYQPIERTLRITRGLLEVLRDFRNPVSIVTKNHLVTRDTDLLGELAQHHAAMVFVSVTTLDADLTQKLEPRTSVPRDRLAAIRKLAAAGIPVGVLVAPVIPGLTDHEMLPIMEAARAAGAMTAGFVPLRLPFAVKDIFVQWLTDHLPDRREKVLHRIASLRGGKLNDCNFGARMRGSGVFAEQMGAMFKLGLHTYGYPERGPRMSTEHFCRPSRAGDQLTLFGA